MRPGSSPRARASHRATCSQISRPAKSTACPELPPTLGSSLGRVSAVCGNSQHATLRDLESGPPGSARDFTPSRVWCPMASTPPTSRSRCSGRGSPPRTTPSIRLPPNPSSDGAASTRRWIPMVRARAHRRLEDGSPWFARESTLGRTFPSHGSRETSGSARGFPTTFPAESRWRANLGSNRSRAKWPSEFGYPPPSANRRPSTIGWGAIPFPGVEGRKRCGWVWGKAYRVEGMEYGVWSMEDRGFRVPARQPRKARRPVMSAPTISEWMSWVPS